MELYQILTIFAALLAISFAPAASADVAEIDRLQAQLVNGKRPINLGARLKRDHGLSDSQIAALQSQGLDDKKITIAVRFAKASRKPLEKIVQMHVDQKKSWSEIATELRVDPKDVGLKITRKVRWEYRARSPQVVENAGAKSPAL